MRLGWSGVGTEPAVRVTTARIVSGPEVAAGFAYGGASDVVRWYGSRLQGRAGEQERCRRVSDPGLLSEVRLAHPRFAQSRFEALYHPVTSKVIGSLPGKPHERVSRETLRRLARILRI
jgi:hypothetical protein